MAKYKSKKPRSRSAATQTDAEWYVPFVDGHACIYHGHESPDDHSKCGPQIFCCPNARRVLSTAYPKAIPAEADWQTTDAEHLVGWMGPSGPKVFYFFYCDSSDKDRIRFVAVHENDVPDLLRRELSLHSFDDVADTISLTKE